MSGTRTFWKGVLFGAVAGGLVTLLDRTTRKEVLSSCQETMSELTYYAKHPDQVALQVKEATQKLRSTVEQVSSDIAFISEKVDELREVTPQVAEMVKDTKEAFVKPEEL